MVLLSATVPLVATAVAGKTVTGVASTAVLLQALLLADVRTIHVNCLQQQQLLVRLQQDQECHKL